MKTPNAIVVLAASIKQDASDRWVSTGLTQADDTLGAPGGTLRVCTAAVLAKRYPGAVIIAMGGKGYDVPRSYSKDRPLLCEILWQELRGAGIPAERILLERESGTTYQQLRALSALMGKHGWIHVAVVTNRWHIPRTHAIIESKFPELESIITFVSAEDVLIADNSDEWESGIVQAYKSEWLARRMLKEEQGIRQIMDGTYDFK